jgi:hypothetical protein
VLQVEPVVELFQTMNQPEITRLGLLPSRSLLGLRHIRLDRKIEKLSFCGAPECARDPRVQKSNDSLQNLVGSEPIATVDSEHPPVEAQHHCLIVMGEDPVHFAQA